jgi:hypothetical protein
MFGFMGDPIQEKFIELFDRTAHTEALLALMLMQDINSDLSKSLGSPEVDWIFYEKNGFVGNSKYLFLKRHQYCLERDLPRPLWLTEDESIFNELQEAGFEAGIWGGGISQFSIISKILNCKVFLTSQHYALPISSMLLLGLLTKKAKRILLWHGIGTKRVGHSILYRHDLSMGLAISQALHSFSHFLTPKIQNTELEDFAPKELLLSGYPRNVVFAEANSDYWIGIPNETKEIHLRNLSSSKKLILFAPSWVPNLDRADLLTKIINRILEVNPNSILYVKLHPSELSKERIEDNLLKTPVFWLDPKIDIQPFLPDISVLVTDFSSIVFDALLSRCSLVLLDFLRPNESYQPLQNSSLDLIPGTRHSSSLDIICYEDMVEDTIEREFFVKQFWGENSLPDFDRLINKIDGSGGRFRWANKVLKRFPNVRSKIGI